MESSARSPTSGGYIDGVPTARGKPGWYAATIYAVVTSDNAAALA
jgi:hypothetical protein